MWVFMAGFGESVAIVGQNGGGVVQVAELDVKVVDLRLVVLCAKVGRGASHVARIGLLDGELPDRPPLDFIRVEQT